MLDRLTVAAANSYAQPGETTRNLEAIFHHASRAAAAGAQLVLFPELSLTGFLPNHSESNHALLLREALLFARHIAEPLSGLGENCTSPCLKCRSTIAATVPPSSIPRSAASASTSALTRPSPHPFAAPNSTAH